MAASVGLALVSSVAWADITIAFDYDHIADKTTVTYGGTFDVDGTSPGYSSGDSFFINPNMIVSMPENDGHSYLSTTSGTLWPNPAPWSTYGDTGDWIVAQATAHGGDWFYYNGGYGSAIRSYEGFETGDSVSGWLEFAGYDYAEMGLVSSGSGSFSGDMGTINWSVAEAVPEPSVFGLTTLFGGAIFFIRRRLMI